MRENDGTHHVLQENYSADEGFVGEDLTTGDWQPSAPITLPFSVRAILAVELAERLAFYGVMAVMMPFMRDIRINLAWSNGIANFFPFFAFAACLYGGYLGDSVLGLVRTVQSSCFCMFLGCTALMLTASGQNYDDEQHVALVSPMQALLYLFSLLLIGLAAGGIKANVVPLLAHQLERPSITPSPRHAESLVVSEDERSDGERSTVNPAVFRWVYWCINLGALIGSVLCPFLHLPHNGKAYTLSFALPAFGALFSYVVFRAYRYRFVDRKVTSSLIEKAVYALISPATAEPSLLVDLKQTARLCAVFAFFPVYWCAQKQHHTSYVPQADQMERPDWMPSEVLASLNPLTLIVCIPVFESHVFPVLEKYGWHSLTRILAGLCIQAVCIGITAFLQFWIDSRGRYTASGVYEVNNGDKVSVSWQVPTYIMTAIGEIFASVSGLEFAYSAAPASMKSLVMALYLLMSALGNVLGMFYSWFMTPQSMAAVFSVMTCMVGVSCVLFYWLHRHALHEEWNRAEYTNSWVTRACTV